MNLNEKLEIATVGGGCFWCLEAIFGLVKGVENVTSGYSGGNVPGEPTYREVCSGRTGHAEVIQITFNPDEISYEDILLVFMTSHDPTTLNKQGANVGTQYRSVIFYHDDQQQKQAQDVIKMVSSYYDKQIVTKLEPIKVFFNAEKEHQDYYVNNKEQGYCSYVIAPKLTKLRRMHADKIKVP
ncbi:MAG: peptide-methionine (S)-S-oxide reductase MsrA [Flavobacteriaceae bacterium]|nr:peptide-methionine (S)-S-oxide reductase MsrA [Flavobacteriaceae bacterium]